MCGIAGFYGFRDDELIKKFSQELKHRGPDGEGFYIDGNVSLLNRRLAIIDRKGGDQPIFNEDKSVVVTYNGEIYNYRNLRKELEMKGHAFRTKSDTEVIVHGYEEWGVSSFDRFNGMFAIALYDIKKKKLILARDHFGIKPLYFSLLSSNSTDSVTRDTSLPPSLTLRRASLPKASLPLVAESVVGSESHLTRDTCRIVFSSEIKPLIYSGLVKKKPNDRIIYRYLRYRIHDDQRETFFEGVYRLMPGEYFTIQSSKFKVQSYTNLKNELLRSNNPQGLQARDLPENSIKEFRHKLEEAIRLRLISEVPVGTCLSGGLDSSTVVAVINKLLKEHVKEAESVGKIQNTFSAVFPGGANDEEKYIDALVKSLSRTKLRSHKIYPKPEEFFQEMEEFVRTQEEPTISTGPYAQYKVMQEAHKYVTVLLDGQGADEMLAGYIPYYFVYLRQLWKKRRLLTFFKVFMGSLDVVMNVSINQLIDTFGIKKSPNINQLLNSKFVDSFKKERFEFIDDNLKKRLVKDIFSNSLPALLRYEDKNAMRFSIEGRVPFLDFNLMRYLFSLPDEAIIKDGWNKKILREAIQDLVPEKIRMRRNKIGFTTPEYEWFMRMKNKIYSIFLSESFAKRKYFNQPEVIKAFQKFIEGKNDETMLFWRLLNVEMWLRVFFDPPSHKASEGQVKKRGEFEVNKGKKLGIKVDGKKYLRMPLKTELFQKGDALNKKITDSVYRCIDTLIHDKKFKSFISRKFFIVISEKVVAIVQGRSYFIWDIKTGVWANLLAKFVKKTPYGIGLGSPWTMQLAITELGLLRILFASLISLITKPFGFQGLFYKMAGKEAASIDGPTEYSLYPSNVSAKLGPKNPEKVASDIHKTILTKRDSTTENFLGVAIIDANDLGQKVLGNSTPLDTKEIEKIFSDNPMGQADEQTPIVLVTF